jgi:hypothetical protein
MYGKAIVAVVYAAVIALRAALGGDNHVSDSEWVQIGIAVATAVGVWLVPITAQYKWVKTAVAVLLAVLQALATIALGDFTQTDVTTLVIVAIGALGVFIAPATSVDPSGTGDVSVGVGADD